MNDLIQKLKDLDITDLIILCKYHGTPDLQSLARALYNRGTLGDNDLFYAIEHGNENRVKELLDSGVDINGKNNDGNTPLVVAAGVDEGYPIVNLLIRRGANVGISGANGVTPLMAAVNEGQVESVESLLDAGADPNVHSDNGDAPLVFAAVNDLIEIVKLILNKPGRDVNIQDSTSTAIVAAVANNNEEIIGYLIENSADVNIPDDDGWTPLMYAAQQGNIELTGYMLESNANPLLTNNDGDMAIDLTTSDEIRRLLDPSIDVNERDEDLSNLIIGLGGGGDGGDDDSDDGISIRAINRQLREGDINLADVARLTNEYREIHGPIGEYATASAIRAAFASDEITRTEYDQLMTNFQIIAPAPVADVINLPPGAERCGNHADSYTLEEWGPDNLPDLEITYYDFDTTKPPQIQCFKKDLFLAELMTMNDYGENKNLFTDANGAEYIQMPITHQIVQGTDMDISNLIVQHKQLYAHPLDTRILSSVGTHPEMHKVWRLATFS